MSASLALAIGLGSFAAAQSDESTDDSSRMLDTVVVTAEKRQDTAQNTAIALTAITGDRLIEDGVSDLSDLSGSAPNLQIGVAGDSLEVGIRGISSNDTTERGEPAAALHLDGIYIARTSALALAFFDLERVEVLRGPQGTLYGRNATAGSINIITKKPENEFGGSAMVEFGNHDHLKFEGAMNLPVTDDWALRAAFVSEQRDGYQDNSTSEASLTGADDLDNAGLRIHSLYEPGDTVSWLLTADYWSQGGVGAVRVPLPLDGDPFSNPLNTQPRRDNEFFGLTSQLTVNFNGMELTYLAGYREDNRDTLNDQDTTDTASVEATVISDTKTISHELRLASTSFGVLDWLAGIYYFEEDTGNLSTFTGLPNGAAPSGAVNIDFLSPELENRSIAVFGQSTFNATDRLGLTLGLRYTEDEKKRLSLNTFFDNAAGFELFTQVVDLEQSWDSLDWKIGADYALTPENLLYATVSTGYKAGGTFDGGTFDPEELISYEIGSKNRFFDNRLQINLSAFLFDFTDFQATSVSVNPQTMAPQAETVNAGEAEVTGLEIETSLLVGENGRFDFSGALLDAEFTDFVVGVVDVTPSGPAIVQDDRQGLPLTRSPEWSFTASYEHEWELSHGGVITARAQIYAQDDYILTPDDAPAQTFQDGFTRSDAFLRYTSADGNWYAQAFVNNIEDDEVVNALFDGRILGLGVVGHLSPPRTYGVRMGVTY
ncbi:MAG: TonB-dependent receptor [Hyphomonadaceae bacterium]|nr:TonB-dependent receptor [Hyphomonadaceae bacterium]